jgi:hypothetical protein
MNTKVTLLTINLLQTFRETRLLDSHVDVSNSYWRRRQRRARVSLSLLCWWHRSRVIEELVVDIIGAVMGD